MVAAASPTNTTYQARIIKPDGYPLESGNVNFKFTVLDNSASCILYAETYSAISMSNSAGNISFALGSGVKTFPVSSTTFAQVFNNATSALTCDAGGPATYTPQSNDDRKVVMQFNDGSGWQTLPAMAINAVPYSIYSGDSLRLGGVSATSYVRSSTIPTCTASQALQYNGSSFSCLTISAGGGSITAGDVTTALGYTPVDAAVAGSSFTSVVSSLANVGTSFSTVTSTLTSLGSSVTAVSTSVGSLSSSFTALTSLVNSHTTSITSLTSSYASLAASVTTLSASYTALAAAVSSASAGPFFAADGSVANPSYSFASASGTGFSQSSNQIYFSTAGVARMTFNAIGITGLNLGNPLINTSGAGPTTPPYSFVGDSQTGMYRASAGTLGFAIEGYERMRVTSSAVGILTSTPRTALDVSGGLRIGMESSPCSSVLAGTIRYTGGNVEYCNGTTWTAFGTGAGVTSAAVTAAYGYTPANNTALISLSSSYTSLAASMAALSGVGSSPWVTSGSTVRYTAGEVYSGNNLPTDGQLDLGVATGGPVPFSAKSLQQSIVTDLSPMLALGQVSSLKANPTVNSPGTFTMANLNYMSSADNNPYSIGALAGSYNIAEHKGFGVVGNILGVVGIAANSSSATVTIAAAGQFQALNAGTGTVNNMIGVRIAPNLGNAMNSYGLLIDDQSSATASATYNIYSYGINSRNYFNGRVGIGTNATSPTALLQISNGNATLAPLRLTSGTLLSSPTSGAIEYDGFNLYYTDGTNTRRTIATAAASAASFTNVPTIENAAGNIALVPNTTGSVVVSATTASTNSQTGALVVKGGLGVAGNIYSSGTIITTNNIRAASITATQGVITPYLYLSNLPNQITSDTTFIKMEAVDGANGAETTFEMGICDSGSGLGAACFNSRETALGIGSVYHFKGSDSSQNVTIDNGRFGIGTAVPLYPFEIKTSSSFTGVFNHTSNNVNAGPSLLLVRQRGTSIPAALQSGDEMGGIYFRANDGVGANTTNAHIEVVAGQNQTPASRGNYMTFSTTPNGQTTRQEGMRIHTNGFVGIGNTSPNALLQVGPSGSQNANYNIYAASYKNDAGQGQYVGNWGSTDYWGIGPATQNNDSTLRIGVTSDRTGTWSSSQNLNLLVAGNISASGTITDNTMVIPASATLLMASCPVGWNNLGLAASSGSGAAQCNGVTCSMCQAPSATLVPALSQILMETCPSGWTSIGKVSGGGSAGYVLGGQSVAMITCQSPAVASVMPKGMRVLAPSCHANWTDLGTTGIGTNIANCPTSSCRVCETPNDVTHQRILFSGDASGTSLGGPDTYIMAGKGGSTSGHGGSVIIRSGSATGDGQGGAVSIIGGAASSTAQSYSGGGISLTGGSTNVASGTGGTITLAGGLNTMNGQYGNVYINSSGGNSGLVGIGTTTPLAKLDVNSVTNIGSAVVTNISQFASGGIRMSNDIGGFTTEALQYGGANGAGAAIAFRRQSSESNIDFYTNDGNDLTKGAVKRVATINRLGYLGIGTSDPVTRLHAITETTATTPVATFETSGTAGRPYVQFKAENQIMGYMGYGSAAQDHLVLMNYASAPTYLGTSSTVRMTIASNGRVGVGTQAPNYMLDVVGSGNFYTNSGGVELSIGNNTMTTTNKRLRIIQDAGASYTRISNTADTINYMTFGMDNARIGIGTATPTTTLDVSGSATVNYLHVRAGDAVDEGGEIQLLGSGAYGNVQLDNWRGNIRLHSFANGKQFMLLNGAINADSTTANNYFAGNVGIGNASPGAKLDVTGDIRGTGTVASWSDVRVKKNIATIPDSLNKVLRLRGVEFDWRNDEYPEKKFKQGHDIGVVAQEVEKVFPEAVETSKVDGFKSVAYSKIVAPLIEAVKELYYKVTGIERKVASIEDKKADKSEVEALKAENAELKSRLERLEKIMLQNQKSK